jgi:hypothetical protein
MNIRSLSDDQLRDAIVEAYRRGIISDAIFRAHENADIDRLEAEARKDEPQPKWWHRTRPISNATECSV